ncbi:hypothetical protein ACWDTT_21750 [Streptosporangium sandarakinum]
MKALLVLMGVAAVGALVAVLLLSRAPADGGDGAERVATDVTIGGHHYPRVDGASVPGSIWKGTMTEAARGTRETRFTRPDTGRFGGCRDACPN